MSVDFTNAYAAIRGKSGLGTGRLYLSTRDRIHLSLNTVAPYSKSLERNNVMELKYSGAVRYVTARDVTYDLLVSVYDVNTTASWLARLTSPLTAESAQEISQRVKRLRAPNLELRAIGLQDNAVELVPSFEELVNALSPQVQEIDLFGKEVRHIAFDTKLGMSFNLLLLNRIYRPGELQNLQTTQEFEKTKSQLLFV